MRGVMIGLILGNCMAVLGQTKELDRLIRHYDAEEHESVIVLADSLLTREDHESHKALIYARKADAIYFLGDVKQCLSNYLLSAENFTGNEDPAFQIEVIGHTGFCYNELGLHDRAVDFYKRAMAIAEKFKVEEEIAIGHFNLSNSYLKQGKLDLAMSELLKAYEIDVARKDTAAIGFDLNALGFAHMQVGNPKKAIQYYHHSVRLLKLSSGNPGSLGVRYNNLSYAFIELKQWDSAIYYNELSQNEHLKLKDSVNLAERWVSKASILFKQGNVSQSIIWAERAKEYFSFNDRGDQMISANQVLIEAFLSQNNTGLAMQLVRENIDISRQIESISRLQKSFGQLSEIARKAGNYRLALESKDIVLTLGDSIKSIENRRLVEEMQVRYEVDNLEQENQLLTLSSELKDANLARAKNAQYAILIGGVSLILVLVIFFTLRYKKERAEREAQELQVEALKKRFMELHASPAELAVEMHMPELNQKLHTPLTEREFEALKLSIEGKSNTEIADKLFISVSTVKFHLRNAYGKMGVGNRKEAFQFMLKSS